MGVRGARVDLRLPQSGYCGHDMRELEGFLCSLVNRLIYGVSVRVVLKNVDYANGNVTKLQLFLSM